MTAAYDEMGPNWLTIGGVQVSADSLTYNFTYECPTHQIIFTDTRSWRAYPNGHNATPDLLPPDQRYWNVERDSLPSP